MTAKHETADELVDTPSEKRTLVPLSPLLVIQQGLQALAAEAAALKPDLAPAVLDKTQRALRLKCVTLRTSLDSAYEEVNRPLLDTQRAARKLVAEIKEAVARIEDPIDADIKAREAEKARKRAEEEAAEQRRVQELRGRIERISGIVRRAAGKTSAEIEEQIKLVAGIVIGDDFQDLKITADRVHTETLAALRDMHIAAVAHEAEVARLKEQQAELDRQRAAQEATRRQEEERATAARVEQQRIDAEAAEARRKADAQAKAERDEADRVARVAREAEEQRLAGERAELQRQQEATRAQVAEEQRKRDEAAAEERRQQLAREEADRLAKGRLQAAAQVLLEALVVAIPYVTGPDDLKQCQEAIAAATDGTKPAVRRRKRDSVPAPVGG